MGTTILRQFLQCLCHNSPWNYAVFWKLQHQNHMLLTWGDGYSDCPKLIESMNNIPIHEENSVGPAVAYMSKTRVVDEVAYTGNHLWNFADSILSAELKPREFPDEWLFQFAAGIKTILLVPVVPHGVLQLGSLEMVAEDLALVALIKDKFNTYQSSVEYPVPYTLDRKLQAQSTLNILMENFDEPAPITTKEMNPEETMIYDDSRAFDVGNVYYMNDVNFQSSGLFDVSRPANETLNAFNSERTESNMLGFSGLEENIRAFSFDVFGHNDTTSHENPISFFNFPTDRELYEAFGPVFSGQTMDHLWDPHLSAWESSEWIAEGDGPQHQLEAVIARVGGNSDNNLSHGVNSGKSSVGLSGQIATSSTRAASAFACHGTAIRKFSTSDSSFQSAVSSLTEEGRQEKVYSYPKNPSKGSKLLNASKKRGRAIDSRKPRPRDRQLIQDRVKELRELVPDGAKCSIDGLLDRTIKHMLFLRSVTDQADKLKKWIRLEEESVSQKKSSNAFETNERGGSSRGYELGSGGGLEICPILVKDLESPGEMLIEMLCDDHGLFLEIAEVICRLNLTILKGTVKSFAKEEDTWAHFLVKAPRGFHRLDIFWPLMQLLQQQNRHDVWPISSRI